MDQRLRRLRREFRKNRKNEHPARRATRVFGYAALVGLAFLFPGVPIGIVIELLTGGLGGPVFLVPLGSGVLLTSVGWIMWASWSATLDRYEDSLDTTAKLTLAATTALVLGVVCVAAVGLPLYFHPDAEPPDSLIPVIIGLIGLGVLLVVGTIIGAAVYGGIALGGPRWWWAGALLCAGLFATAIGMGVEVPSLTVLGVAALVVSVIGYRRALKSGLAQAGPDTIESAAHRERHDL
ncbi:hypothetical protein [Nocardiopsis sp. JB363]|uniref:hypothetical protein n=1 Tax=Nocardiopsis sp. JB363 TaxID=1434837 RepID=UPI001F264BE6|nr:hypothetical protein [Nocardiopsis sp. JB363]